jgi:hypothetical protein
VDSIIKEKNQKKKFECNNLFDIFGRRDDIELKRYFTLESVHNFLAGFVSDQLYKMPTTAQKR